MICLTGDVHQMTMHSSDQAYLRGSEVDAALKYVEITRRFNIKSTLFVTGRCVEEEPRRLYNLANCDGVELGGHNYNAFKPLLPYRLSQLLLNRKNGPAFIQKRDIEKTIKIIKDKLGIEIKSWRDHGYRYDSNTKLLLFSAGIKYFSDLRSNDRLLPYIDAGLWHFPINVLPDHDHIYHGIYKRKRSNRYRELEKSRSPFGVGRINVNDWLKYVKIKVEQIVEQQGIATLLVHPSCMEVVDNFTAFTELCRFLSSFETNKISDLR